MQATTTQFAHYHRRHESFMSAYQKTNEYVGELYKLPKKLTEEAGRALDNLAWYEEGIPGSPEARNACSVVIDFMDQLDDFTVQTIRLFQAHKRHVEDTRKYVLRVSVMKNENKIFETANCTALLLELDKLNTGLKKIKASADDMIVRLEKLELHWEDIKDRS